MVTETAEDLDCFGLVEDELEAAIQVFYVRRGRVVGRKGFVVDKVEPLTPPSSWPRCSSSTMRDAPLGVPRGAGARVAGGCRDLRRVAQRRAGRAGGDTRSSTGRKRELLETVPQNAGEEFTRHRLRAADHEPGQGSRALQEALGLPESPLRIECYDMSHLQGTDYVGSMVVMEDGLPKRRSTAGSRSAPWRATTTSRPWTRS